MSDNELISGCIQGRKEAWDLFVERFSGLIYWSVRRTLVKSPFADRDELCDEIFQDVFHKLMARDELARLKEAVGLKQFLVVIACRQALDKMKALSRSEGKLLSSDARYFSEEGEVIPEFGALEAAEAPDQTLARHEREAIMADTLAELDPRERFCVEMHYVEGKSHREIAEIVGIPVETASTIIRRTREKLKTSLERKGLD